MVVGRSKIDFDLHYLTECFLANSLQIVAAMVRENPNPQT